MKNKILSTPGPLTEAAQNTHIFCLNMVYAGACDMTVKALQMLEGAPETTENILDRDYYLEILFMKPLEENV
jgi:hypothetical protein